MLFPISPKPTVSAARPNTSLGGLTPPSQSDIKLWLKADTGVKKLGARQFTSGNTEYFDIADNADLSGATGRSKTISCWVYLDSLTVAWIAAKYHNTSNGEYGALISGGTKRFQFLVVASDSTLTTVNADETGDYATGQWYHYLAWFDDDADTVNIRINNNANWANDSLSHTAGMRDGALDFAIGDRGGSTPSSTWNGRIDEFSMWNRVLTSDEQDEVWGGGNGFGFDSYSASLKTGLVAHYRCDEGSGNLVDAHTNGYNLTDRNTVTTAQGHVEEDANDTDLIARWEDQSAGGHDATEFTVGEKPAFISADPSVDFNGSTASLKVSDHADLRRTSDITAAVLFKSPSFSATRSLVDKNNSWAFIISQPGAPLSWRINDAGGDEARVDFTATINTWYAAIGTWDKSTTTCELFIDGTSQGTDTDALVGDETSNQTLGLGHRGVTDAQYFNCEIKDVIFYQKKLDSAEITQLSDYLVARKPS